jgi:hypothetical protein
MSRDSFNLKPDSISHLQLNQHSSPSREPEVKALAMCAAYGRASSSGDSSSEVGGDDVEPEERSLDKEHFVTQLKQQRSGDVQQLLQRKEQGKHVEVPVFAAQASAAAAAQATPERLNMVMSRASAALAASGALSRQLSDVSSPTTVAAKTSPLTASWQATIQSCSTPGQSHSLSQRPSALAVSVSDDSGSDSSSSSGSDAAAVLEQFQANLAIKSVGVVAAATTPRRADAYTGISVTIPASANTAPILLVRQGSSNSSSGSASGSRVEPTGHSTSSDNPKLDAGFYLDGTVGISHRQKLRTGNIAALRPMSAGGGTRKSVRPDLASGLGFKTIDVNSRSDSVRVRDTSKPDCV